MIKKFLLFTLVVSNSLSAIDLSEYWKYGLAIVDIGAVVIGIKFKSQINSHQRENNNEQIKKSQNQIKLTKEEVENDPAIKCIPTCKLSVELKKFNTKNS